MNHQKSDLVIDMAYMCALIIVLFVFLFSFPGSSEELLGISPGPGEDAEALLLMKAADSAIGALFSVLIFITLVPAAVVVHEFGHLVGGLIKGYRPAHFCIFGVVVSMKGKRLFHYDPTARFGGYTVMCTKDFRKSPLFLIRMGPVSECIFFLAVSAFVVYSGPEVTGIFLLGEILAYLSVRALTCGHGTPDDSVTAGEVLIEGPEDYNRLMDVYDGMLLKKASHGKSEESSHRSKEHIDHKGVTLTIKKELSMYGREE